MVSKEGLGIVAKDGDIPLPIEVVKTEMTKLGLWLIIINSNPNKNSALGAVFLFEIYVELSNISVQKHLLDYDHFPSLLLTLNL